MLLLIVLSAISGAMIGFCIGIYLGYRKGKDRGMAWYEIAILVGKLGSGNATATDRQRYIDLCIEMGIPS